MKYLFILLTPLFFSFHCRDAEQKNKDEEAIARKIRTDKEDSAFIGDKKSYEESLKLPQTSEGARTMTFHFTGLSTFSTQWENIQGLSVTADIKKLNVGGNYVKSYWMSFKYKILLSDGTYQFRSVRWGYADHKTFGLMAAIEFWKIPGGKWEPPSLKLLASGVPLTLNAKTKFTIRNLQGTNLWRFSRNDVDIWEVDLETNTASPPNMSRGDVATEVWGSNPSWGNTVINSNNLMTLKNGVWTKVPSAYVTISKWCIQGTKQNSSLAIGEFNIGGNCPTLQPTTSLWQN